MASMISIRTGSLVPLQFGHVFEVMHTPMSKWDENGYDYVLLHHFIEPVADAGKIDVGMPEAMSLKVSSMSITWIV
jgi:hypothetical protein